MKKESVVIKREKPYKISNVINDLAIALDYNGNAGLIDNNTKAEIVPIGKYGSYYYDYLRKLIIFKDKNKSKITIYDIANKHLLVEDWSLKDNNNSTYNFGYCVLISPNGKVHILDDKLNNTLSQGFDDVTFLSSIYIKVTDNGKKGIYVLGKGILYPIVFDDIQFIYSSPMKFFVFESNNKKQIAFNNSTVLSVLFDNFSLDCNKTSHLIYCQDGSHIYVYNYDEEKLLFDLECDEIKLLVKDKGSYYFKFRKDNKWGIVRYVNNKLEKLLNADYDNIDYNIDFLLEKDGKKGVFIETTDKMLAPNYESIQYVDDCCLLLLFNDGICDIYDKEDDTNVLTDCKIIYISECYRGKSFIVCEKNGLQYLLYKNLDSNYIRNIGIFDKIKPLGYGFFEVEKNGEVGLANHNMILGLGNYKIQIIFGNYSDSPIFFILEYENKIFKIGKIYDFLSHPLFMNNILDFGSSKHRNCYSEKTFQFAQILGDIIILKDYYNTYVYDRSFDLLEKLPLDIKVTMIVNSEGNYYKINEKYYVFGENGLEEVLIKPVDLYVTAYESEYGTVVINSFNKDIHESECKEIEMCSDEEFNDRLINYYKQNKFVQDKYPTLKRMI